MTTTPVVVNIYDLSDWNHWIYNCGCGGDLSSPQVTAVRYGNDVMECIFHTGIEVYGVEYAYGGHEYEMSGIFTTNPRDAPGPVSWRESVVVGETHLTPREVHDLVQSLGMKYRGCAYHLLQRNCNHFSEELAWRLCRQRLPSWVNRLAGWAIFLHCLLPQSWVPPLRPPTAAMIPGSQEQEDEHVTLLANGMHPQSIERSTPVPT